MILDHRIAYWDLSAAGDKQTLLNDQELQLLTLTTTLTALASSDTVLVNAQPVLDDVSEAINAHDPVAVEQVTRSKFYEIPCPKPPYQWIWIEAIYNGRRYGALVQRMGVSDLEAMIADLRIRFLAKARETAEFIRESRPATVVRAFAWFEASGQAACEAEIVYWLNAAGDLLGSYRMPHPSPTLEDRPLVIYRIRCVEFWILHTFARLNCHNVVLEKRQGDVRKRRARKSPTAPLTVWHEIVVRRGPELRYAPAAVDGEKQDIRFHKVRGHYADYTKGKGLFGKWKVRIWVEEHAAGSRECGEVVASYTVE